MPARAASLARIVESNWVLLTNVVARFEPFQRTTEVDTKLLPLTVNPKSAAPATMLAGDSEWSVGGGGEVPSSAPAVAAMRASMSAPISLPSVPPFL
ncbi:MAG: hypothetical protein DME11_17920 [Candidatus Rokuibacteriota bacterium]|nr:MAG: hypothetical protein DME11_17920 [Candidatus Rokubacteria bacterium]